jgi:D-glycero-D-manno-heptose 1,7-bisphosphate phosphatase
VSIEADVITRDPICGLRPALFLDRDGTIIEDRGDLGDPEQVQFLPGVIDALRALNARFTLFIVTNQPGIAAGRLGAEQVAAVNRRVVERLEQAGVIIERVFVCPHARADGCSCIKPKPHFLHVAEREHRIDLCRSYTIGDHPHDVEFGRTAGAMGVYVLTGHGSKHLKELAAPDHIVAASLAEAARMIAEASSSGEPIPGWKW